MPTPAPGEVLVRNLWTSVDPGMRLRLAEAGPAGYFAPFALNAPLDGIMTVGEVVESRVDGFAAGDVVWHAAGWREHAVVRAGEPALRGLGTLARIDRSVAPPEAYLGPLGGVGLTAYAGLLHVAELRDGRRRLGLGRRRRGRLARGADRQVARAPRDRQRGLACEGRIPARRARPRRGVRLSRRARRGAAPRGGARRHRRVLRQRRRRAPRGGAEHAAPWRPGGAVRRGIDLRRRPGRPTQSLPGDRQRPHAARLSRQQPRPPVSRAAPRHGRAGSPTASSRRGRRSSTASNGRPRRWSACSPARRSARRSSGSARGRVVGARVSRAWHRWAPWCCAACRVTNSRLAREREVASRRCVAPSSVASPGSGTRGLLQGHRQLRSRTLTPRVRPGHP